MGKEIIFCNSSMTLIYRIVWEARQFFGICCFDEIFNPFVVKEKMKIFKILIWRHISLRHVAYNRFEESNILLNNVFHTGFWSILQVDRRLSHKNPFIFVSLLFLKSHQIIAAFLNNWPRTPRGANKSVAYDDPKCP